MRKLGDLETQALLKRWKIPLPAQFLAKKPDQAVQYAKMIGYPVILKISSPDIVHKTEAGGILTNLKDEKQVQKGFTQLIAQTKRKNRKAKIDGVLVQEMISDPTNREVIIGAKHDPQFGPVLMFGLGGIFVEVMKDVTFRVLPLEPKEVREMIKEIKGYPLLDNFRGQRPVNFRALEKCILSISKMLWKRQDIKELDINPLFINSKKAVAVDAKIVME